MGESGQYNSPPYGPGGFYEAVYGRLLNDEESSYSYYNLMVDDIDEVLAKVEHFTDCKVLQDKIKVLGGNMAIIECPDMKILILREIEIENN